MKSKEVAAFLGLETLNFQDFQITSVKPPNEIEEDCITLLTRISEFELWFNDKTPSNVLAIIPDSLKDKAVGLSQVYILSSDPRLSFVKVLNHFQDTELKPFIAKSAVIESSGVISEKIRIGNNVVIKGDVNIGENSEILDNVVIYGNVTIGSFVRIKSGTVIGQKGFNFVNDENGIPLEFPHSGGVVIGNNVEFGALNTVVQGTLGNTVVGDNVKTDDHVHIAHNVIVGDGTKLTAGVEISGSVTIGKNVWVGPNSSIIDHIQIGDNAVIGIGSVLIKSVPENAVVVGNPGKVIKYNNPA